MHMVMYTTVAFSYMSMNVLVVHVPYHNSGKGLWTNAFKVMWEVSISPATFTSGKVRKDVIFA